MSADAVGNREALLPVLRQDLSIERSASSLAGVSSWVIYDPLQHRFIQIDHVAKDVLSIWNEAKTEGVLLERAALRFGIFLQPDDIKQLVTFIDKHHLAVATNVEKWQDAYAKARAQDRSWLMHLLHSYLYFKIPLFQPHDWLAARLKFVAPLYTRGAALVFVFLGLAGLYFVSEQWGAFIGTFPNFFTLEGALVFSISLFVVKALHELGHAFTAVRYGCRVPTMGVALMVMVPMLYTDVSDAWRLRSRRERFYIGAAGVIVELMVACVATFLWVFLPEGIVRSVVFVLATTSWVMSVGLNLNPLMRFDGYYLLADMVGVDNLQPRSFALGRWKLREILFAPRVPCPESLFAATCRWLLIYAWTVWIYRLVIFTGIALLVYHYFFKALGLLLFAVEIWFFIALPIVSEMNVWRHKHVRLVSWRRMAVTASLFAALVLFAFVPWSQTVYVPAVLGAGDAVRVFPTRPARVEKVHVKSGDVVEKGAVLVQMWSPDIDSEMARTEISLEGNRSRLARTMSDLRDKEQRLVLLHEFDALQTRLSGLEKEKEQLVIRAPVAGKVLELDPKLHAGRWISAATMIAVIGAQKSFTVRGYAEEQDVVRLKEGSEGDFIPDDIMRPTYPLKVSAIAQSGTSFIEIAALASEYGGRIGVHADKSGELVPVQSQFLLEMTALDAADGLYEQEVRGVARLSGSPRSFAGRMWRQIARVLVRESGF